MPPPPPPFAIPPPPWRAMVSQGGEGTRSPRDGLPSPEFWDDRKKISSAPSASVFPVLFGPSDGLPGGGGDCKGPGGAGGSLCQLPISSDNDYEHPSDLDHPDPRSVPFLGPCGCRAVCRHVPRGVPALMIMVPILLGASHRGGGSARSSKR